MEARGQRGGEDPVARLLAGYRPPPGVADELLDPQGRLRPVWRQFVAHLARLSPEELTRRFARGDQYLRDAGVFFRQYGSTGAERAGLAAGAYPGADRGGGGGAGRARADAARGSAGGAVSPTSTGRTGWSPRATCRRG